MKTTKSVWFVVFSIFLFASIAQSDEVVVRAKIGIYLESGGKSMEAKSLNLVQGGDMFKVYAEALVDPAYIYVVHSDTKRINWLNQNSYQVKKNEALSLPVEGRYSIDGKSPSEEIFVICSYKPLKELETLLQGRPTDLPRFKALVEKLNNNSQIALSDKLSKPLEIAGTVRGVKPKTSVNTHPFDKLFISSGKSSVVKRYEFRLKK
jgi:hypothetical protein